MKTHTINRGKRCTRMRSQLGMVIAASVLYATASHGAFASNEKEFDIASGPAGLTLMKLADIANVQISIPEKEGRNILLPELKGEYTLKEALNTVLSGTNLTYEFTSDNAVVVVSTSEATSSDERKRIKEKMDSFEEIIVTAQKREQRISDVPISIAALTDTELKKKGINNWVDLALAVPDMSIQDIGRQRRITIRGVGNIFGSSSLVGVYLDEMPVTPVGGDGHIDLRAYDLERVEVLRGPQGTLFGSGSSGGTIRFITKDPDLESFSANMDLSNSFTRGGDPSQEIRGVVNLPLIQDTLALRLTGTYADTGGWIDQPVADRTNINSEEVTNVRAKLLWQPTDDFSLKATIINHRNDTDANNVGEDEDGNITPLSIAPLVKPSYQDDYDLYNITMSYDFGTFRVLSSSGQLSKNRTSINIGNPVPVDPPPIPPLEILTYFSHTTEEIFTQELRFESTASDIFNWTLGAFFSKAERSNPEGSYRIAQEGVFDVVLPIAATSGIPSESWAVFGETSYQINNQLEAGVGLRYFEDSRESGSGATFQSNTFNATSPKVFVRYDVNDGMKLYASIAKGFRSGGFNFDFAGANPPYGPESVWSYEIGSKMSLFDERVTAEASLYFSEYSNIQVIGIVPINGIPSNLTSNAGDADIKGIDVSLSWDITDSLNIGMNGNLIESELVTLNAESSSHIVGDPLDMVPDYSYNAWADYDFNWSDNVAGYARLDYSVQGKSTFRVRSLGPFFLGESDVVRLVNFRIGAVKNNWRVGLFGKNLTNDRGELDAFNDMERLGARAHPRQIGIELGIDFE